MELSIVTTLYDSAPTLRAFHARVSAAAQSLTSDYEIVMVDDGSPDESLAIALDILGDDPCVRVVELSRNFGHHRAIMTGLDHARGDLVFLIDCDLEEEPEWLPRFHDRLVATDADCVFGQQVQRKGGWFESLSGSLFYRVFNALSSTRIPENLLTVRLMRHRFVRALVAHREREICLAGLLALTGFRQEAISVTKGDKGRSTYDLRRKVDLALRAITSFSDRPLELVAGLGFGLLILSGLAMASMFARKLFLGVDVPGYASLMVSVWFLGGVTLFAVGLIGLYVARVFVEVKQRPYALIRAIHEHQSDEAIDTITRATAELVAEGDAR